MRVFTFHFMDGTKSKPVAANSVQHAEHLLGYGNGYPKALDGYTFEDAVFEPIVDETEFFQSQDMAIRNQGR